MTLVAECQPALAGHHDGGEDDVRDEIPSTAQSSPGEPPALGASPPSYQSFRLGHPYHDFSCCLLGHWRVGQTNDLSSPGELEAHEMSPTSPREIIPGSSPSPTSRGEGATHHHRRRRPFRPAIRASERGRSACARRCPGRTLQCSVDSSNQSVGAQARDVSKGLVAARGGLWAMPKRRR